MQKKLLVAALALACVASLGFAGEDGRPPRRDGRPPFQGQRGGPGPDFRGPGRHGPDFRGPGRCGPWRPGGPGMEINRPRFPMRLVKELDFTADQKDKFIDVMTNHYRLTLGLRLEIQEARWKARELRRSDTATGDEVIALSSRLGELRGKIQAANIELRAQIKAILTQDQIAKMEEMNRPRPPRFPGRNFHGRGPARPHHMMDREGFFPRGPHHFWMDADDADDVDYADGADDAGVDVEEIYDGE